MVIRKLHSNLGFMDNPLIAGINKSNNWKNKWINMDFRPIYTICGAESSKLGTSIGRIKKILLLSSLLFLVGKVTAAKSSWLKSWVKGTTKLVV